MDKKIILLASGATLVALFAFANSNAFSKKKDAAAITTAATSSTSLAESSSETDAHKPSVLQQLEEEREQKLEDDRNKAEHDKLIAKKEASPECKFWRLQKIKKPTPKVDEQINAHCGIPVVPEPQK